MERAWRFVAAIGFLAVGTYVLVTGEYQRRGADPSPTMARIGGAALVFIGIVVLVLAFRDEGADDL